MSDDNSPFAGVKVPFPDAAYATRTTKRLLTAQVPGTGFGSLSAALSWVGRVQGTDSPAPFGAVRGLVVRGAVTGGFAAGDEDAADTTLLNELAARTQLPLEYLDTATGGAAEDGPVLDEDGYLGALDAGRQAADSAIDSGVDLLVLSGLGPGSRTGSIAVTSHLTRTPAVELSPRLRVPGGLIDDNNWMRRTAAVRDAFARLGKPGRKAHTMLSELGGPVMATLTGVIVAAAVRRTPVVFDGPVTAAAALVARDFSLGAPKWCYAPDRIPHPVVDKAAGQVGMAEPFGVGLDLGDGIAVSHALPVLQETLRTIGELPFPKPESDSGDDAADEDDAVTEDVT